MLLWNTSKTVFRGEFRVLNTCINECEGIILSELNSHISEKTNIKPKVSNRKEIIGLKFTIQETKNRKKIQLISK